MGSARRRRSGEDRSLRETAGEHVYTILSQRRESGWYDALVGAISGAVVISKTQAGKEMKAIQVRATGGPEVLELRELPDLFPVGEKRSFRSTRPA